MNSQEYYLNIRPGEGFSQTVKVSQGDVGRPLLFHLMDGATPLTIAAGSDVVIHATKPSGLGFTEACTVTGSSVSVSSTIDMTQEFGLFPAEIVVSLNDEVLATTNFSILVERSPHPAGTTDGVAEDLQDIYEQLDDLKEDIENISGISDDVKVALLDCFAHVAWTDDQGQDYYDALEEALYAEEPKTLVSISAVYTQSGTVYDTDTLDSLKTDLVVTATYDDSSTAVVTAYTLSGTLTVGTSTITVTYEGKTATFSVTVSQYWTYQWDYTMGKLEEQTGWGFDKSGTGVSAMISDGEKVYTANNSYYQIVPTSDNAYGIRNMTEGYGTIEVECYGIYGNSGTGANLRITISKDSTDRLTLQSHNKKWRLMKNGTASSAENTVIADAPDNTLQTIRLVLKNNKADVYVDGIKVCTNIDAISNAGGNNNLMHQNGQDGTGNTYYAVIKSYKIRVGAD